MKWVHWSGSLWHAWDGRRRAACGAIIPGDAAVTPAAGHPPKGLACGNCMARLGALERFARGARESQEKG